MTISISGQVPAEAQNGMVQLEESWTQERTPEPVYAIVKIERHGFKFVDADQKHQATMKFTHIEPMSGAAVEQAKAMLEQACLVRGGGVATDVELDIPAPEEPTPDFDTPLAEQSVDEAFEPEPEQPARGRLKATK